MTMPHLMNCPHQGEGWCLDCVKELHERNEKLRVCLEWIKDNLHSTWRKDIIDEINISLKNNK